MSRTVESHPSRQELIAFAEGLSNDSDSRVMEAHVEHCERCAKILAECDIGGGLVGEIRTAVVRFANSSPPPDELPGERNAAPQLASLQQYFQPSSRAGSIGRLEHYEIVELAGKGTFASVFKAYDKVLERFVAIKLLMPDLAVQAETRQQFLREARAAAAIRQAHVVQIHTVCEHPLPYLVMEYIPGENLQQRLDKLGRLPAIEVIRLGRQIAAGLQAAHSRGLIHRDIKPGNILLDATDDSSAKITDFGLVWHAQEEPHTTRPGVVAGTPHYMSPEQVRGQKLDHRSDLFSLGTLLYRMLSGTAPFYARSTLGVATAVRDNLARPLAEIVPEAPAELCAIIARLHAKLPADRFQCARDVCDALAQCAANPSAADDSTLQFRTPTEGVGGSPGSIGLSREPAGTKELAGAVPHRRRLWRWLTIAVLSLILTAAVVIIRTNTSEFIIATDSPVISSQVFRDGGIVVANRRTQQKFHLEIGANRLPLGDYDLSILSPAGLEFDVPHISLKRFGTSICMIRASRSVALAPPAPLDKPVSAPAAIQPSAAIPTAVDYHRQLAQYLLSQRATIFSIDAASLALMPPMSKQEELPDRPFLITSIALQHATDQQIKSIADLAADHVSLQELDLNGNSKPGGLTSAALHDVARITSLRALGVHGAPRIRAEDFRIVSTLPSLYSLNVGDMPIGDGIIQQLDHFPRLTRLWLNDCEVTDEGLLQFHDTDTDLLYINSPHITDRGVEHLAQFTNLRDIRLNRCRGFTGSSLAKLTALPLTKLVLQSTGLQESALPALAGFAELNELELVENGLTDTALPVLAQLPLQSLVLKDPQFTESGIAGLHESLLRCRIVSNVGTFEPDQLKYTQSVAAWILKQGWKFVARLTESDSLSGTIDTPEEIPSVPFQFHHVDTTHITEANFKRLIDMAGGAIPIESLTLIGAAGTDLLPGEIVASLLRLPSLEAISIGHTRLKRQDVALLQKLPALNSLTIGCNDLPVDVFTDLPDCPSLRRLGLNDCGMGDAGLQPLRNMSNIEDLYLNDIEITDDIWDILKELKKLKQLLIVGAPKVTCHGLRKLSELPIESLTIRHTALHDNQLQQLAEFKNLTLLELAENAESDAALSHITRIPSLKTLILRHTQIGNRNLGELRSLPNLSRLVLADTHIDDSGLETICQIPSLLDLDLSGLPITDTGLARLKKLRRLGNLNLTRTKVTANGIRSLQAALPHCEIVFAE